MREEYSEIPTFRASKGNENWFEQLGSLNSRRGILREKLGGLCGPLPKNLTLVMTKICDFQYPIYDLTLIQYPVSDLPYT